MTCCSSPPTIRDVCGHLPAPGADPSWALLGRRANLSPTWRGMNRLKKSSPPAALQGRNQKEKAKSDGGRRHRPAACPAAMVDIEREVPGKTAERICAAPI